MQNSVNCWTGTQSPTLLFLPFSTEPPFIAWHTLTNK